MNAYESTMNFTRRAVWAQIDLDAAAHNMRQIRKHVGPDVKIAAVVKANAYGHGSVELAKTFAENGADCFAVSSLDEAVELRRYAHIDKEIFILGHTDARRTEELLTYDIEPAVFNLKNAEFFSQEAQRLGKTLRVHIAVDTGMSRVGFQVNEFSVSEIKAIAALPNIEIRGMFTHFAVSDIKDKTFTREQYGHFRWMCKRMEEEGIHIALRHCCNSAAALELPEYYCDMVRPGIIMYGCEPSPDVDIKPYDLRPVMSLRCCIAHVKLIDAGATVSYGRHYTAPSRRKIATLPVGYADGYSRILSGKVDVLYHGHRVPQVGAICMDQCMIDVSGEANVHAGDEVVLFGRQGDSFIPIEEIAAACGTINYEIMCDISRRVPRVYMKNGKVVGREEYLFDKP
ncbi:MULTISPECIES: alanine racemase [Megasphaera]|uniref:Alanine racemase n=1 Tax=Megasphaera elsdenii DSM 20460 TaxID=1064535 RepID=G0VQJ7_MEGEL|nr:MULTISPECIES: alanine racemase [Megasphaera]AVO73500.1 alanine racemase [Megasphaera elsdenii DSM 20460]MCI7668593.1 alanine racemase [Megasphaera elsdenii]MCQ4111634.1 alanine racemase [Megasphaera sp. SC8-1]MDY5382659.1 alanine racemase [Megasphaera elsdenii]CCC73697.1 alanine racemase [Megasphaera elsdenii DSM 20460]